MQDKKRSDKPEYMVEVRGIGKSFGNMVALEEIDLRVKKGEFLTIIGPNGSGKSTLIKTMIGLVKMFSGQVFLRDKEVSHLKPHEIIKKGIPLGYVPQLANVFPSLTVEENMKMGLHSLVLLDIQGDKKRFMNANEGIELLIEMEKKRKEQIINDDTLVCVVARAGSIKPTISAGRLIILKNKDFGPPLHTLVFPGKIHFMEKEALEIIANFSNKSW